MQFFSSDCNRQKVGFSYGKKPHQVGALIVILILFHRRTKKTEQNRHFELHVDHDANENRSRQVGRSTFTTSSSKEAA